MKNLLYLLLIIVFIVGGVGANFVNEETRVHKVLTVDKIEATEGNADGFRTRVYYQVSTDIGAYHIRTAGLNAAPQCAKIKPDSTYALTTRGVLIPIIGVYPCIIEAREYERK